jgi:hypothetical protein
MPHDCEPPVLLEHGFETLVCPQVRPVPGDQTKNPLNGYKFEFYKPIRERALMIHANLNNDVSTA